MGIGGPAATEEPEWAAGSRRLAVLLATAFILIGSKVGEIGLLNGFRMMRRPDPAPSDAAATALA